MSIIFKYPARLTVAKGSDSTSLSKITFWFEADYVQ